MPLEREESAGQREAAAALARSVAAVPVVAELRSETSRHAAVLHQMRARNHFAESMDEMFRDRDRGRRGRQ